MTLITRLLFEPTPLASRPYDDRAVTESTSRSGVPKFFLQNGPPATLMIAAAEALGRNFDFVRADFYEVDGRPLFGELTFYPGSGLEPLEPASLNEAMGAWWSAVREKSTAR